MASDSYLSRPLLWVNRLKWPEWVQTRTTTTFSFNRKTYISQENVCVNLVLAILKLFFTKCKFALHIKRNHIISHANDRRPHLEMEFTYMLAFASTMDASCTIGMCKCLLEIQLPFAVTHKVLLVRVPMYFCIVFECKVELFHCFYDVSIWVQCCCLLLSICQWCLHSKLYGILAVS